MIKKTLSIFLALFLMVAGFSLSVSAQEELDIALSVPSLSLTFFVNMEQAVEEVSEDLNVNITTFDARDDMSKQVSDVEDIIVREFDGVLISPIESKGMAPAVQSLKDSGIPVITIDRGVEDVNTLSHVGADNVEGGRIAGKYIAEKLNGEGNVLELTGSPGATPTIDRGEGFNEIMDEYSDIEVLDRQTGRFSRSEGMSVMEDLLAAHSDVDAVFSHNDDMAVGALEAIESDGRLDDMIVVGFDAIEDGLAAIEEGRLDATIEQFPGGQSERALELMVNYIRNGEEPPQEEYIEPSLITNDNLEDAELRN
ncbi:MAG: sugar ABC transporter substrate-binding protein [Candidatus Woesearchaeota archaeon]